MTCSLMCSLDMGHILSMSYIKRATMMRQTATEQIVNLHCGDNTGLKDFALAFAAKPLQRPVCHCDVQQYSTLERDLLLRHSR